MKLPIAMNLGPLWVEFLAAHEFEALHWAAVGCASAPDSEILAYAEAREFVVFTHDLDFGTLLAASRKGNPSVVQIRTQDVLPSAVGLVVVQALRATREHLERGALVTIDRERRRIRLLPI